MPDEPRDPLEMLAEEEQREREAIDAAHRANEEAQRADEAAARAAGDEPEDEGDEEELEDEGDEPDEPQLYAGKYRTVEEMERAYTEAQRLIADQGARANAAERRALELENQYRNQGTQQTPQAAQNGQQPLSKEELEEWLAEDPVGANYYIAELAARVVADEQNRALAPMMEAVNTSAANNALEQLKRELGPNGEQMLAEHREALIAAIEADKGHFVDPETRLKHMKQAVVTAAYEAGTLPGADDRPAPRRRDRRGKFAPEDVHVEGGSGAQPARQRGGEQLSPEEQELQDLHPVTGWKRDVDEKGIPLPL